MIKPNLKLFVASLFFAAVALVSANSIFAQSSQMVINIPFEFQVGNKSFAAGDYNLARVSDSAFLVRTADGANSVIIPTSSVNRITKRSKAEHLIFNRYGEKYFLREIFSNRNTDGFSVLESKSEKNLQKELAKDDSQKNKNPEQVAVAIKSN